MAGLAILCSGQAGQRCDMLDGILGAADCSDACGAASRVLGQDVAAWWAALDPAGLFDNANAQFAIALYQVATWGRLASALPTPRCIAGYSLGELLAWHVAGALDAEETLRLVRIRARLMDEHAPSGHDGISPSAASGATGGCLVLWRGDRGPALRAARDRAMADCGLAIAIHRPGGELLLGGPAAAVDCFFAAPGVAHPELKRLPVTVPSHTPWLAGAVAPFAAALSASRLGTPNVPVLAGIDAAVLRDRDAGIAALSRQLACPLRWDWCMDALAGAGVNLVLELGPGKDLAQQAAAELGIEARSAEEFGSPEALMTWVAARCSGRRMHPSLPSPGQGT